MNTHVLPDSIYRAMAACEENFPWLIAALDAMPVLETDQMPTAGCSKYGAIYCNPQFLETLSRNEAGTVMAHEVWHWLSEHFARVGGRDAEAWNLAADAEINDDLPFLPSSGITPQTFGLPTGLTAEEYYSRIAAPCQTRTGGRPSSPANSPSSPANSPSSPSSPAHATGSASDGQPRPWESPQHATPSDPEELRETVASAIKSYGLQGSQREWAEGILKPKIPSFSVRFRAATKEAGATTEEKEATYAMPSKRSTSGLLVPGKVTEKRSVCVLLDSSGSIYAYEAPSVLGSVWSLASRFGEVEWAIGDTSIQARGRNKKPTKLTGGGGTDMRACLNELDLEGHSLIVCVTDGETPWPQQLKTPTVVCLTPGGSKPFMFPCVELSAK